jgi:hypothetical protein
MVLVFYSHVHGSGSSAGRLQKVLERLHKVRSAMIGGHVGLETWRTLQSSKTLEGWVR